jgi:hypothetical protein
MTYIQPPQSAAKIARDPLAKALFRWASTPPAQLTDLEKRLISVTIEFMTEALRQVRCDLGPGRFIQSLAEMRPLSAETFAAAARLSLAAASEIEPMLRALRDRIAEVAE